MQPSSPEREMPPIKGSRGAAAVYLLTLLVGSIFPLIFIWSALEPEGHAFARLWGQFEG
jgi:hypothetical protein